MLSFMALPKYTHKSTQLRWSKLYSQINLEKKMYSLLLFLLWWQRVMEDRKKGETSEIKRCLAACLADFIVLLCVGYEKSSVSFRTRWGPEEGVLAHNSTVNAWFASSTFVTIGRQLCKVTEPLNSVNVHIRDNLNPLHTKVLSRSSWCPSRQVKVSIWNSRRVSLI